MKPEKRFNLWDIEGTTFIEDHKEGSYHIGKTEDVDINSLRNITKRLNIYADENEQLKQSNTYLQGQLEDYSNVEINNVELRDENEQLKKELSEYKDFVLSDDKILCYTCLFCTHKGIYEVDCDVKGHVDVHGTCHSYTKKELQE